MSRVQKGWLLAMLGAVLIAISMFDSENYWWSFYLGVIPYIVLIVGFLKRCPVCKSWWAAIQERSELLDRWYETKDINRLDVTRNNSGKIISTTNRTERVSILCERKKLYFKCECCDARWTKTKVYRSK